MSQITNAAGGFNVSIQDERNGLGVYSWNGTIYVLPPIPSGAPINNAALPGVGLPTRILEIECDSQGFATPGTGGSPVLVGTQTYAAPTSTETEGCNELSAASASTNVVVAAAHKGSTGSNGSFLMFATTPRWAARVSFVTLTNARYWMYRKIKNQLTRACPEWHGRGVRTPEVEVAFSRSSDCHVDPGADLCEIAAAAPLPKEAVLVATCASAPTRRRSPQTCVLVLAGNIVQSCESHSDNAHARVAPSGRRILQVNILCSRVPRFSCPWPKTSLLDC